MVEHNNHLYTDESGGGTGRHSMKYKGYIDVDDKEMFNMDQSR